MNNPRRKRSGYQGIVSNRRKRRGIYPKRLNILRVYPNPSTNKIRIKYQGDPVLNIKIISLNGELLKVFKTVQATYDISNLVKGVCFVQVTTHKVKKFTYVL